MILATIAIVLLLQQMPQIKAAYENDPCETKKLLGVCRTWSSCPVIRTLIQRGEYTTEEVVRCGFTIREEIICCPFTRMEEIMIDELSTSTTTTSESPLAIETRSLNSPAISPLNRWSHFGNESTTDRNHTVVPSLPFQSIYNSPPTLRPPQMARSEYNIPISPTQPMFRAPPTSSPRGLNTKQAVSSNERPAVRACKRILSNLKQSLAEHILDGIPAELGQLPHMAAIDYSNKNKRPGSVNIQCAGTLIDERFVLTAAHCVARRDMIPEFVYLGVANLTDPEEMEHSVKRKIKNIYIHDDYSLLLVYNDIALLELEEPITFNEYVYPACLHTDLDDLSRNTEVMVSGWGTMTARGNVFSNILLKVPLTVTPIKKCQRDYNRYGLVWRIQHGIKSTQLCAEGRRRVRDACNGDSGGPLVSVGDKLRNTYYVIGVVSAGFSCGDKRPGLYIRVAAYLDYIENIVWPNDAENWQMGYV